MNSGGGYAHGSCRTRPAAPKAAAIREGEVMNTYNEVLAAGAAGLGVMEFWCITHPEGDLIETASKDLTMPVRIFCDVLGVDWSDAQEDGYSLGKVTLTKDQVESLPIETLLGSLAGVMQTH